MLGTPSSKDRAGVPGQDLIVPPIWGAQNLEHEVLVALGHSTLVRGRVSALVLAETLKDGPQCGDGSS